MPEKTMPDWSGKCISMILMDSAVSHDLESPRFETLGGRTFIVGTIPKGASVSGWSDLQSAGIAWDRVSNYFLFDDLDSYYKAVKISESYKKKKNARKSKGD